MRVCGVGRAVYRSALTYFSVLMLHDVYVRLYKCVLVLCSLIALEDEDMEITLSADSFSGFLHFPGNVSDFDKKTKTNLGRLTFSTTSCGSNTPARSRILKAADGADARLCQEIKNICFSVFKL